MDLGDGQILIIKVIEHPQNTLKPYHLKPQNLKHVETYKMFQRNLRGLIHHWKGLDMEMVDYDYHQGRTPSADTSFSTCRDYKISKSLLRLIHHWKLSGLGDHTF